MEYAHEELMNEMGIGQNDVPSEIKKQIISFAPTKQIDILKMKWFIDQVLHNLPKVDKKPEKRVSKTISLEEMMNKVINRIRQNMSISFKTLNKEHKEKRIPGIDRGHMCPAADNQCDQTLLDECFYFSNIAPQYHSLNAGDWKKLEIMTRELTMTNDSVFIWCGSVGSSKKVNGLAIPTKCWKVIYVVKTNAYYAYIFLNNPDRPKGLDYWRVSINEVEKLTGFKFKPER
jgi:endonuclease G